MTVRTTGAATIGPGAVAGDVTAPPSKSVTHRALLLAAQASAGCTVRRPLSCDDTAATLRCLAALGARFSWNGDAIAFAPAGLRPPTQALDCGGSATTLSLMLATAARLPVPVVLDGDHSLRARDASATLQALGPLGARSTSADGHPPLRVQGPLRPGTARVDGAHGSQAVSAALLAMPMLAGDSTLLLMPPVRSRPYIDVTLAVARQAGLSMPDLPTDASTPSRLDVAGGQLPRASWLDVEGDWSAAAYPLAAAAITGGDVRVHGLAADSAQGDAAILGHLRRFGATVDATGAAASCRGAGLASPGTIDVTGTPDLFPILCVVAATSRGTTRIVGAPHLRGKESDRIAAMRDGLARMGIRCREGPDGLEVTGGHLQGAVVDARGDHRVHMAFAVAGLAAAGATTVTHAASVAKSHPAFHDDLAALGAVVGLGATPAPSGPPAARVEAA